MPICLHTTAFALRNQDWAAESQTGGLSPLAYLQSDLLWEKSWLQVREFPSQKTPGLFLGAVICPGGNGDPWAGFREEIM